MQHGWTGINPGFSYQMLPPAGEARLADYVKAGWDRADVEDYLAAFDATFNAPTMLPYLRIRGTAEYWSVLDRELVAAMGGRKTADGGARRHGCGLGRDHRPPRPASSSSTLHQQAIGYRSS